MNFLRGRNVCGNKGAKKAVSSSGSVRVLPYAQSVRTSVTKKPAKPAAKPVAAHVPAYNNTRGTRADAQPVIRLRTLLIGLCVLAVCMLGPLALVWKQSYINQVSIRLENSAQNLKVLNGEITSLKLERTRLSAAPRIERIARARGLEYPSSERMVILGVEQSGQWGGERLGGFAGRVKSFILGERG